MERIQGNLAPASRPRWSLLYPGPSDALRRSLHLALAIIPLALVIRWQCVERSGGQNLSPRPDCLEYAATAHALVNEGRFCLHVGPDCVPPRPAPGWPILLTIPVSVGVPSESLWYITGLFGAAHAWLLGMISAALVTRITPRPGPDSAEPNVRLRALLAGVIAGCGWAVTPIAIEYDRTLMNDMPSALMSNAALFLAALAWLEGGDRGPWRAQMMASGLATGWAMAMRPIAGWLLAGPLLILFVGGAILHGFRPAVRRLGWGAVGAAAVVGLVMLVMRGSGYSPWQWSGYAFWLPELYGELDAVFSVRNAFEGHPSFPLRGRATGEPLSHLQVAGQVLLGLRSIPRAVSAGAGRYWPIGAWMAALVLIGAGWRGGGRKRLVSMIIITASAGWVFGHVVVYALYFFPAPRFYLPVLAWCWIALAVLCTACWGSSLVRRGLLTYLLISSATFTLLDLRPMLTIAPLGPDPEHRAVREAFAEWRSWKDEKRQVTEVPFDPVHAQALGLFTPEVLAETRIWGPLPNVEHVWRLRALRASRHPPSSGGS